MKKSQWDRVRSISRKNGQDIDTKSMSFKSYLRLASHFERDGFTVEHTIGINLRHEDCLERDIDEGTQYAFVKKNGQFLLSFYWCEEYHKLVLSNWQAQLEFNGFKLFTEEYEKRQFSYYPLESEWEIDAIYPMIRALLFIGSSLNTKY